MNDEKLTISFYKSPLIPEEVFIEQQQHLERKLAVELWNKLAEDIWYTIKIKRTKRRDGAVIYIPEYNGSIVYTTDVYVGKVQPIYMEWKPPAKLNWKERLRVLFTGEVPAVLREK